MCKIHPEGELANQGDCKVREERGLPYFRRLQASAQVFPEEDEAMEAETSSDFDPLYPAFRYPLLSELTVQDSDAYSEYAYSLPNYYFMA